MSHHFCTLEREVELEGVGLHSGQSVRLRLLPSSKVGVTFARVDLPGAPEVAADVRQVSTTIHATTIESGEARVSTIEHLLAALWASDYTHVRVELNGPEVPILDGSSRGWVELLEQAGQRELTGERPIARLQAPVWLESKGTQMFGLPLPIPTDGSETTFRLSVGVNFDAPGAGAQSFDGLISAHSFAHELASARTFTLEGWLAPLQAAGLIKGGSLENAILIGSDGTPSSSLRFENELARHKALDCVGDLALALCARGARFHGHIFALRAGHGAHRDWVNHALASCALTM
ncbi:UDP-3-O-acyl-N-acetylglucosamine deacetylase [Abditibacteriota bacterium]|nr:UDP-3-O-acyl-N-acetylglucosamine deacetylase [Abditibacteriota bacterium]